MDEFGRPMLVNSLGALDVDIIIDEGPDTVNMQGDTMMVLQSLGPQFLQQFPEIAIELAPLPASVKKPMLDRIQQQKNTPPPPDPKMLAVQAKTQADMQMMQAKAGMDAQKMQADMQMMAAKAGLEQQQAEQDTALKYRQQMVDERASHSALLLERMKAENEAQLQRMQAAADIQIERIKAASQLQIDRERHTEQLKMDRQRAAIRPAAQA